MRNFFLPATIVGALPVTLLNGTPNDATQVMTDLQWIVNQVNANAAELALTPQLAVANNFTAVQSGVAATASANFPLAGQVRDWAFNTLTSTLGTNTLTARIAQLSLSAYSTGQVFSFTPSQTNTGPANMTVDAAGSSIIFSGGGALIGGEMTQDVPLLVERNSTQLHIVGASPLNGTSSSTFTFNGTGGTSAGILMTFQKIGRWVRLNFPSGVNATTGTSSTQLVANTALPTAIRPASGQSCVAPLMLNNGTNLGPPGFVSVGTNGVVTIQRDGLGTAFTDGAAAGLNGAQSVMYFLG